MLGDQSNAQAAAAAEQQRSVAAAEESTPLLPLRVREGETTANAVVGTSSVSAAVFNFTNSIVGAGCIALGSGIGQSGGLISVVTISFFAALSKSSFDLVIGLSLEAAASARARASGAKDATTAASYESLGHHCYGPGGRTVVTVCKLVYSYGTMVAYIKIIKDNFASAVVQLSSIMARSSSSIFTAWVEGHEDVVTMLVSLAIIFPICLLRNMSGLERCSIAKVAIVFSMLFTMIYLLAVSDYALDTDITTNTKWFAVRPGFLKSLGSFVFTFVAQHTVNLNYGSLKPELQTMANWKIVSTLSTLLSAIISMAIGLVLYITFWTDASSDIFSLYPAPSIPVAFAKLLLSVMMMFTYPVTFLACRELCIPPPRRQRSQPQKTWWLLKQNDSQLILPLHVAITFLLLASTTILAILAPSLLDVLNLVGSATGTLIAFVLPALFSYKMRGYTHLAATLLLVGGSVGISGTFLSLVKLMGMDER